MSRKVTALGQDEHALQTAVVSWAALQSGRWPALKLLFAIPNGAHFGHEMKTLRSGKRVPVAAIRARRMKAEGLRPGVPDLCLPVARGGHHGLFLEMKTRDGHVREEQVGWLEALREEGYMAVVCRSVEEAVRVLRGYLESHPSV